MSRCIQLARCGDWHTAPNPMVGAVVVHEGRIIGEGFHRACGQPHAEVNAIRSVREPELLPHSTIYVSLEPCAHWGKTPPCADLIIEKRIPRVVIGCRDPFSKVDGLGIKKLRDAGCEVVVGVLEEECRELNKCFFTFHEKHRPYVVLKWAQSSDGFIDRLREEGDGQTPVLFSTPLTMQTTHHSRVTCEAIMVGGRTWRLDRPKLTARLWSGRQPRKVVVSGCSPQEKIAELYREGVQSVLVEGGASVHQQLIDAGLADEIWVETAPIALGEGVKCARVNPKKM